MVVFIFISIITCGVECCVQSTIFVIIVLIDI